MTWMSNLYVFAETNLQVLSCRLRVNQFSDLNGEQFRQYVHGGIIANIGDWYSILIRICV